MCPQKMKKLGAIFSTELMKTMFFIIFFVGLLCSVCCPTPNHGEQISPLDVARASQRDAHGNRSSQGLVETLPVLDPEENARKTNTDPVHPQRHEEIQPPLSRVQEDKGGEKTEGTEGNRTVFTEKEDQLIHSNKLIHSDTAKELVLKSLQENARDGKTHGAPNSRESPNLIVTTVKSPMPVLDPEENSRKINTDPVHSQRQEKIQLPLSRVHEDEGSEQTEGTEGNHTGFTEKEAQLIHSDTTKELVWKSLQENVRDGKSHDAPNSRDSPNLVDTPARISSVLEPRHWNTSSWDSHYSDTKPKNKNTKKPGNKINETSGKRRVYKRSNRFATFFIACYRDEPRSCTTRDMNGDMNGSFRLTLTKNSPGTCRTKCKNKGYKYAGVQFTKECYCSNSYGRYGKAPKSECNMPCNDPELTEYNCGGGSRNAVYKTGYTPPVQGPFLDGIERKPVFTPNQQCVCDTCNTVYVNHDTNNFNGMCENIALGKVVLDATSPYKADKKCLINNGIWNLDTKSDPFFADKSCKYSSCGFCSHSEDYTQYPFIEIDLGSVVTVYDFTLVRRALDSHGYLRMLGVQILVDGKICYEYERYHEGDSKEAAKKAAKGIPHVNKATCKYPVTGRYVRVRKVQNIPIELWANHLVICELYIWVCEPGYYGSRTDGCKPCRKEECDSFPCDNFYGCKSEAPKTYNLAIHKGIRVSAASHGNITNAVPVTTDGILAHVNDGNPFLTSEDCIKVESSNTGNSLWLRVDLAGYYFVDSFIITNLDRSASEFLRDVSVLVSFDSTFPNNPSNEDQLCFKYKGTAQNSGIVQGQCKSFLHGRYVWITTTRGKLGFCELEVMGRYLTYLGINSKCEDPGRDYTIQICPRSAKCENQKCKTKVNKNCNATDECVHGSVCEFLTCKVNTGFPCEPGKGQCRIGHVCDERKCRLDHGQGCKDNKDMCRINAVCDDTLNLCGLKVNEACTTTSQCTAGATCDEETCRCQSKPSRQEGAQCKPKPRYIGSECDHSNQCNSTRCHNNKCACKQITAVYPQGFICKLKAGGHCHTNTECNTGMKCEGGNCKIISGGTCDGNEAHCMSEHDCDARKVCKAALGQPCSGSNECKQKDICSGKKCKIVNGGSCTTKTSCASGFCEDQKCKIDGGQTCTNATANLCRQGSFCEGIVCKFKLKEQCTNDSQCQSGTVCSKRTTKECRWTLGHGCEDDTDCEKIAFCDNLKQCRIPKTAICTNHHDKCLSGGFCSQNGKCACTARATKTDTKTCEPADTFVGGYCTPSQSSKNKECFDKRAHCNANISQCECKDNFVTDPSNLECRINFGDGCSRIKNYTAPNPECISGAVCNVNDLCAADVGSYCKGHKLNMCKMGTRCDTDYICRLELHHSCADYPNGCRKGTICDIFKRCKYPVGKRCNENKECMAATHCSAGKCQCFSPTSVEDKGSGNCVINKGILGGACEGNKCKDGSAVCNQILDKCECKGGYDVNPLDLSCGKGVGQPCRPTGNKVDDECTTGLVCDPAERKCRIKLGERCDGELRDLCVTGDVCDYDSVCRLNLTEDCTEDRTVFCKSGTLCDTLGQCSFPVGGTCSSHKRDCQAGAMCVKSTCVCNKDISTKSGSICRPKVGQYQGSCQAKCKIKYSKCVGGLCECVAGYPPTKDLYCGYPKRQLEQTLTTFVSLIVLLAIVCVVIGGAVGYARYRHKTKKREELTKHEAETMHQLKVLGHSVQGSVQIGKGQEMARVSQGTSLADESSFASTSVLDTESSMASTSIYESEISTAPTSTMASEISSAPTTTQG